MPAPVLTCKARFLPKTHPPPVPQDVQQSVSLKSALPRFAVFAAGILVYLLLLHLWRESHAVSIVGLAFQYAVLLPGALWALGGLRNSGPPDFSLPPLALALAGAYLLLVIPLARHEADWPTNPTDESCYAFQARILRTGRAVADPLPGTSATVQTTPDELNYQNHVLIPRGWFTHFPPGWPLLLLAGQWLGAPWIVNPLLGLILLRLMWMIGRETFSLSTARLSLLMAVLSPFFLVNAVRQLSHMSCAVLVAGACLLLFRGLARRQIFPVSCAFGLLVLAFPIRPYTAFAEAVVLGGATLWYARRDRKFLSQVACAGVLAAMAALLVLMAYNRATTGHAFVSPYAGRVGSDVPSELTLQPRFIFYFFRRWGWTTLSETIFSTFPFLFLLAAYAVWREREKPRELRILACVFAVLPLAHLLHTENSYSYFGSRFHFEGLFAALILGARGAELLVRRWALPRAAVLAVLGLLGAMQIADVRGMVRSLWEVNPPYHAVKAAVTQLDGKTPLVFLQSGHGFNARFINFNQADWRHAPTVYLIDADPPNHDAWACRFGRTDWVVLRLGAQGGVEQMPGQSRCAP